MQNFDYIPAEPDYAVDDELFDDGSTPASLEVVEQCARELEISLSMRPADAREANALSRTIQNLTGTLAAVGDGRLVMGRSALRNVLNQLNAARTRLAQIWKALEFELSLDRDEVFAY